jgi:hypothetical protein
LFDTQQLTTTTGENIAIHHVGTYNPSHAGPDFSQASITIDHIRWNGAVEIHIKSNDWIQHQHTKDPAYDAVILHVVYENQSTPICRNDGSLIPCLELKQYMSKDWLQRAEKILNQTGELPCRSQLQEVPSLTITSMKERMLANRIERKANQLLEHAHYQASPFVWKLHAVVQSFAMGINTSLFHRMVAQLTPTLLNKLVCAPLGVEAYLFGRSGMLDDTENNDLYFLKLKKEFDFIKKAYQVEPAIHASEWKFLRTRPANFPTVRIAQLATFLKQANILDQLEQKFLFIEMVKLFDIELPTFHRPIQQSVSKAFINHFIINTMIPLWGAYYFYFKDERYYQQLWKWYERLPAEHIALLSEWKQAGVPLLSAFDSQALLELNTSLCSQKKCLSCSIGIKILQAQYVHVRN